MNSYCMFFSSTKLYDCPMNFIQCSTALITLYDFIFIQPDFSEDFSKLAYGW